MSVYPEATDRQIDLYNAWAQPHEFGVNRDWLDTICAQAKEANRLRAKVEQQSAEIERLEDEIRAQAGKCDNRGSVGPKVPRNYGMRDVAKELRAMIGGES